MGSVAWPSSNFLLNWLKWLTITTTGKHFSGWQLCFDVKKSSYGNKTLKRVRTSSAPIRVPCISYTDGRCWVKLDVWLKQTYESLLVWMWVRVCWESVSLSTPQSPLWSWGIPREHPLLWTTPTTEQGSLDAASGWTLLTGVLICHIWFDWFLEPTKRLKYPVWKFKE